jgi:hypothetical protein
LKKLAAASAALVAALGIGVSSAWADGVAFGVNDNAGLYGNAQFWTLLKGENMSVNTIILRWDETTADGFTAADASFLPKAMDAAAAAGVKVEFAVSPRHSAELSDQSGPTKFAAWLTKLAQTYPQVTSYVVMNECNQGLFVNPQNEGGKNVSAAECGTWLAAGYDALKAVNSNIFVWGLGLSPRGNPPSGGDQPSTDPIDWLGYLGQWYKQSGRTKPLMDGLDLHPYPIPQSMPFAQGYNDPRSYSVANLSRAYTAFYNAFNGTAQPTVGPGRLPVQLNEVGIQTAPNGHAGYTDAENANTPSGGVIPPYDTESYQAQWYTQLVDAAECDADITNVNIFKLIDETSLLGWQSGLYYADGTAKASAAGVRDEISKDAGKCPTGAAKYWAPGATTAGGVGGTTSGSSTGTTSKTTAKTVTTSIVGSYRKLVVGFPTTTVLSGGTTGTATLGKAATSLVVSWSILGGPVTANTKRHTQSAAKPLVAKTVRVAKGKKIVLTFSAKGLKDGSYRLVITVKAVKGATKASISTRPFAVKAGKFV